MTIPPSRRASTVSIEALVENFTCARATLRSTCCGLPSEPISRRSGPPTCSLSSESPTCHPMWGSPRISPAATSSATLSSYEHQDRSSSRRVNGCGTPDSRSSSSTPASPARRRTCATMRRVVTPAVSRGVCDIASPGTGARIGVRCTDRAPARRWLDGAWRRPRSLPVDRAARHVSGYRSVARAPPAAVRDRRPGSRRGGQGSGIDVVRSASASGAGMPSRKPWAASAPRWRQVASCCGRSIPSATT